ncbi:hypothetical protein [Pengzhenrongella sicca]|uniref:Uncharacterized protein n=1 Tax=Pengzhenrongella sicca TaxID=2819238 RepID=A0A8A4ZEJ1_9MICO|nr:hypothetical protein [Pengzhenrongella sicca]QTE29725.1 hypothetical protein J4E96_01340 [Pengzhenrongella sicca]
MSTALQETTQPAQVLDPAWITATVRPAGTFGTSDSGRLRALLGALSACASIVVLDLQAARLGGRAGAVVDAAAGACCASTRMPPRARASPPPAATPCCSTTRPGSRRRLP